MKLTIHHEEENEVRLLYYKLIEAWNNRSAADMANLFQDEGNLIGFDGSFIEGQSEIGKHLATVFFDHPTASFVQKIRKIQFISAHVAKLHAIAGMVPPGGKDINPAVNAIQSLIATKENDVWKVALFQNTPAAFHGRPHMVEEMTEELQEELTENSRAPEGAQGF
ncbi:SgcJ/EcaC family oxidoreductase [Bdellovibrio reynosensis]|uniref:SgcJ/EcaC family oxidoreductase n=1 Tax=Bdellovibrio reynosensis TaxID=2835041 RepID=A0ABY4C6X1_9BACT|nr:SgcJ/EcaC family oxidoreductase [Bdellovibrio reynosensis]UOF00660.1 SgcJ/EcaC family oxidoreductase [Bdellovibrio reynosensis]